MTLTYTRQHILNGTEPVICPFESVQNVRNIPQTLADAEELLAKWNAQGFRAWHYVLTPETRRYFERKDTLAKLRDEIRRLERLTVRDIRHHYVLRVDDAVSVQYVKLDPSDPQSIDGYRLVPLSMATTLPLLDINRLRNEYFNTTGVASMVVDLWAAINSDLDRLREIVAILEQTSDG